MKKTLHVTPEVYREILDRLREGRKIQAIKALRLACESGLKEAKYAIDRLTYEHSEFSNQHKPPEESPSIITTPKIIEVTLDYGMGPVKVNLDTMEMTVLTHLHSIGLDAVADALDVVEALKAINNGHKVRIVEEE